MKPSAAGLAELRSGCHRQFGQGVQTETDQCATDASQAGSPTTTAAATDPTEPKDAGVTPRSSAELPKHAGVTPPSSAEFTKDFGVTPRSSAELTVTPWCDAVVISGVAEACWCDATVIGGVDEGLGVTPRISLRGRAPRLLSSKTNLAGAWAVRLRKGTRSSLAIMKDYGCARESPSRVQCPPWLCGKAISPALRRSTTH